MVSTHLFRLLPDSCSSPDFNQEYQQTCCNTTCPPNPEHDQLDELQSLLETPLWQGFERLCIHVWVHYFVEYSARLKPMCWCMKEVLEMFCCTSLRTRCMFTSLKTQAKYTRPCESTEPENMACTWFGEICSCCCLARRNKFHQTSYKPYFRTL